VTPFARSPAATVVAIHSCPATNDVVALETLRLGLRGDTLLQLTTGVDPAARKHRRQASAA